MQAGFDFSVSTEKTKRRHLSVSVFRSFCLYLCLCLSACLSVSVSLSLCAPPLSLSRKNKGKKEKSTWLFCGRINCLALSFIQTSRNPRLWSTRKVTYYAACYECLTLSKYLTAYTSRIGTSTFCIVIIIFIQLRL